MEFFTDSLRKALVGNESQTSDGDIIEKLVQRVIAPESVVDKRDACRALKSLSKKYRIQVGAQGMDALLDVISDSAGGDSETLIFAMEAICTIVDSGYNEFDNEDPGSTPDEENIGMQFSEIYLKKTENIEHLIHILKHQADFRIKWECIRLMTILALNKPKEYQDYMLSIPNALACLMEQLFDERTFIRNDVLFMMGCLTKGNPNIQKIVAFQNAFDILFAIIEKEGFCKDEAIEDAYALMYNLLKKNSSNQKYFYEGSYIQKLNKIMYTVIKSEDVLKEWSNTLVINIRLLLRVIRTLVSTKNCPDVITACQNVMFQCGLLKNLCDLLMSNGVPVDILAEDICAVADAMRGNVANQEYFGKLKPPSSSRSAVIAILMSMVNEKQAYVVRCAVLYCFQCFLSKNEQGQAQVIQTLLPSETTNTCSEGQLLCGGLFSSDSVSNWFASVALMHTLFGNSSQKKQLLRVQIGIGVENNPLSLLRHALLILQKSEKTDTKVGLLMFLCTWLTDCDLAVAMFLEIPSSVSFLTTQICLTQENEFECLVQGLIALLYGICIEYNDDSVIGYTRKDLCCLVYSKIQLETFINKLQLVWKHNSFLMASQKPTLKHLQSVVVGFDYEFCHLFKKLEAMVIHALRFKPLDTSSHQASEKPKLLERCKDTIRDQDDLLCSLKVEIQSLEKECSSINANMRELNCILKELRIQNCFIKVPVEKDTCHSVKSNEEFLQLKEEHEKLKQKFETLQLQLMDNTETVSQLQEGKGDNENIDEKILSHETISSKHIIKEDETQQLKTAIQHLEMLLDTSQEENLRCQEYSEAHGKVQRQNAILQGELQIITSEQDDLTVLLDDQKHMLLKYEARIKELEENNKGSCPCPKSGIARKFPDLLELQIKEKQDYSADESDSSCPTSMTDISAQYLALCEWQKKGLQGHLSEENKDSCSESDISAKFSNLFDEFQIKDEQDSFADENDSSSCLCPLTDISAKSLDICELQNKKEHGHLAEEEEEELPSSLTVLVGSTQDLCLCDIQNEDQGVDKLELSSSNTDSMSSVQSPDLDEFQMREKQDQIIEESEDCYCTDPDSMTAASGSAHSLDSYLLQNKD